MSIVVFMSVFFITNGEPTVEVRFMPDVRTCQAVSRAVVEALVASPEHDHPRAGCHMVRIPEVSL